MMLNIFRSQIIPRIWKVSCLAISFMSSLVKSSDSEVSHSSTTLLPQIHSIDPVSPITSHQIQPVSPSTSHEIEPVSSNSSPQVLEIDSVPSFLYEDTRGLSKQFRKLTELVNKKDSEELGNFGGVVGIARFLKTDTEKGIVGNDLSKRRTFGSNTAKKPDIKKKLIRSFFQNFRRNINYHILTVCAIFNLVFGILISGPKYGWFDGGGVLILLFLNSVLSALILLWVTKQLHKLQISDVGIDVVRNGQRLNVLIVDLVVGDVTFLKVGDEVPTNGLFIDGQSLQVNESSMAGRSDHVQVNSSNNPFLLCGSKVVRGSSKMLVTSVGMYTGWEERTPLQFRVDVLNCYLMNIGTLVALSILTAQSIYKIIREPKAIKDTEQRFYLANSVITIYSQSSATLLLIDLGLDLVFELALVNSLRRMSTLPVKFRNKASCETMGAVTVICTNEAGTLTLNEMKVTKCYVGTEEIRQDFNQVVSKDFLELFYQGIAFNNMVQNTHSNSLLKNMDSRIEKVILMWADEHLGMEINNMKRNYTTLHFESFKSHKKQSRVLIKSNTKNSNYVHWKGAADTVVAMCSRYYESTGEVMQMNETKRSQFNSIIQGMASCGLICIAFAQKHMEHKESSEDEQILSQNDLTLLGIIGMIDPCRSGGKEGIESCRNAGVHIKIVNCDDVYTAKAIATRCGMLETNQQDTIDQVIEGVEFRNYTPEERLQKVDNICVMARSSPEDKLLMVQCLKQKGHVVAITGDGTNDIRGLKEADVGLYMGTQGTEVTKKFSDIVILDNDFSSVATVINQQRCSYINIQKVIQYQLTIAISTMVINVIAAVSGNDLPLTTFESLFVDITAILVTVMASMRPLDDPVLNSPVGRTEPLITNVMWRNILAPAMYQIGAQSAILFYRPIDDSQVKSTLIFSITVLCQVFNPLISMMIKKKNVYEWFRKNTLFLGITGIWIMVLVVLVRVLGTIFKPWRLSLAQWGICFAIAGGTVPIRLGIEFVPVSEKPLLSYATDAYTWVLHFLW